MSATLTISVSDSAWARLRSEAAKRGTTPEAVAVETIEGSPRPSEADPLLQCIGMFASDVPDAAENHDHYLGQALYDEMIGQAGSK